MYSVTSLQLLERLLRVRCRCKRKGAIIQSSLCICDVILDQIVDVEAGAVIMKVRAISLHLHSFDVHCRRAKSISQMIRCVHSHHLR
jgi:hypothetical protein